MREKGYVHEWTPSIEGYLEENRMERYNLREDAKQFAINKRWMAYVGRLLYGFWLFIPMLFIGFLSQREPRPAPVLVQWFFIGGAIAGCVGLSLYTVWKIVRGGDTFVFDAHTHLFERNGHVVSHWDGISQIVVVEVPHRRDRRGFAAMFEQDEYRYTYRLAARLHNGKQHVLDECRDKQTITELAQAIAAYTHKTVGTDVADHASWFT